MRSTAIKLGEQTYPAEAFNAFICLGDFKLPERDEVRCFSEVLKIYACQLIVR